jgi:hypothetical protein
VPIYISSVGDLALGSRVDAVDLAGCQRLQTGHLEGLGQSVDSGMLEELVASLVDKRGIGITLKIAGVREFAGKVVASVEKFEEASDGIEVFVSEDNCALLVLVRSIERRGSNWGDKPMILL